MMRSIPGVLWSIIALSVAALTVAAPAGDDPPGGPPNETCEDAIEVMTGGEYEFTNAKAVADGDPTPCGQIYADVWYRYDPQCYGDLWLTTCGHVDIDTRIAVYYDWGCPPGEEALIVCNDDGPDCPLGGSEIFTFVECGQPVLIRVGGATINDAGFGTMFVDCSGAPCSGTKCNYDLDGSDFVDAADIAILLANWGTPYGAADLAALLAEWGECLYLP